MRLMDEFVWFAVSTSVHYGHCRAPDTQCSLAMSNNTQLDYSLPGVLHCFADVNDAAIAEAAAATDGFSGRELAKMIASVQTAVYGGREPVLTVDLFRRVVAAKVGACIDILM